MSLRKRCKKFLSPWTSMLPESVLSSNCGLQWSQESSHIHCAHSYYLRGLVMTLKKGRNFRILQYTEAGALFLVL